VRALRSHRRGGPETLVVESADRPVPGPRDLLVAVHAAGVTFGELDWDESWTRDGRDRTPVIPSHEFSGVVTEVGAAAGAWRPGDEVYGLVPFDQDGAAAEYAVVPATHLAGRPATLSHTEAAALSLSGLTAWQALTIHAALQPGEQVLVLGAAGGVGVYAVQVATALGGVVTATCRSRHRDFVGTLGAHEVLDADADIPRPDGGGFDVVIDTVGGAVLDTAFALLRPGSGRLVTLTAPVPDGPGDRSRGTFFIVAADTDQLDGLARMAERSAWRVPITATYPLAEGRQAYASGRTRGRAPGKTVITVR